MQYLDDLEYHRFADSLGVSEADRANEHLAKKLSYLADKGDSYVEDQAKILGLTCRGSQLINEVYRYSRLR